MRTVLFLFLGSLAVADETIVRETTDLRREKAADVQREEEENQVQPEVPDDGLPGDPGDQRKGRPDR